MLVFRISHNLFRFCINFVFLLWFRFTYKVVVEIANIESSGKTVLECFGDPKGKKKAAAEHAAEGALWYLEHAARLSNSRVC